MKRNQLWINTRVELQWNPLTQQYEEVSAEGYWADADSVAYAHGTPSYDQDSYAWYNDGTESGSTIIGTANNSQTLDADTTYLIRFVIQETAGSDGSNLTAQLEYDVNNSGTWNNVTSTSNNVRAVASTNLTDGNDTTQRLGSGTFVSPNGGVDSGDGAAGGNSLDITANNESEVLFAIQLRSADLSNNDTIQLRVAGLNSYTNTAAATASIPNNVTVTMVSESLSVTDSSLTVQADVDTNVSLTSGSLSVTDGSLTITTSSPTDVTLASDSMSVSDGSLTITRALLVTPSAEAINITDGTLVVDALVNTSVTPVAGSLSVSNGTLGVNASKIVTPVTEALTLSDGTLSLTLGPVIDLTADSLSVSNGSLTVNASKSVSLTGGSLSLTDGSLQIVASLSLTPIADSLTLSSGSLGVTQNIPQNVSLTPSALSITDGTLSVGQVTNVDVTLSGSSLSVTDGTLTVDRIRTVELSGDSLSVSNGTLQVSFDRFISLAAEALNVTDNTLSVHLSKNINVVADSMSLSNGLMGMQIGIPVEFLITTVDPLKTTDLFSRNGATWHVTNRNQ